MWHPKPKGKVKGKGKHKHKHKGGTRDSKGKSKVHLSDMLNYWGSPSGQIQAPWRSHASAQYEPWRPESGLNNLFPICAFKSSTLKSVEHDDWTTVRTRKHGHGTTQEVTHRTTCTRSKFVLVVLAGERNDDFPILHGKDKQDAPTSRMSAPPKRAGQAARKRSMKKAQREKNNTLLLAHGMTPLRGGQELFAILVISPRAQRSS